MMMGEVVNDKGYNNNANDLFEIVDSRFKNNNISFLRDITLENNFEDTWQKSTLERGVANEDSEGKKKPNIIRAVALPKRDKYVHHSKRYREYNDISITTKASSRNISTEKRC